MEQQNLKAKPKKAGTGGKARYDDMGNLIPSIDSTLDSIDEALAQSDRAKREEEKPCFCGCGC